MGLAFTAVSLLEEEWSVWPGRETCGAKTANREMGDRVDDAPAAWEVGRERTKYRI